MELTSSAALNTRSRFSPASLARSSSDQPRLTSSANKAGYVDTSSKPIGKLEKYTEMSI